jgi:hypothetical protein
MLIILHAELWKGLVGMDKVMSFTVEPASHHITVMSKMFNSPCTEMTVFWDVASCVGGVNGRPRILVGVVKL